jgi:transcriptional regulator with XRE-family HTH domain
MGFPYIIGMDATMFWSRILRLVKLHKLTQAQFAEYINIPRSTLARWAQNALLPDMGTVLKMASVLGVTLDYLVYGSAGAKEKKIAEKRQQELEARRSAIRIERLLLEIQEEIRKIQSEETRQPPVPVSHK